MIDMLKDPLFRVGDVVTVEPDIVDDEYYMFNGWGDMYYFVEDMYCYRNRQLRLSSVGSFCYLIADTGTYGWVDGMFVESNRMAKFLRN